MSNKTMLNQSVAPLLPSIPEEWSNETTLNQMLPAEAGEWTNYQVIVSIILGLISITTVLANSLVLVLFFKSKKVLRSPSYILLANLGCADLLVGLIVMPILTTVTVAKNFRWYWGKEICWAFDYFHYLLCATSMFSMVGVAVERYIGVRHPLRHKSIVSRSRATKVAAFCWILAFLLTAIPLTIWPQSQPFPSICVMNLNQPFVLFISFAVYWVPVTLTILMYAVIFYYAMKPFMDLTRQDSSLPSTSSQKFLKDNSSSSKRQIASEDDKLVVAKKRQTILAKRLALVVFSMLIMFGPLFTVFVLKGLDSKIFTFNLVLITGWIRYSNSLINPFIFALNVPAYRREFYRMFLNERRDRNDDDDDSMSTSFCESKDNDNVEQEIKKPERSPVQNEYESKAKSESNLVTKLVMTNDFLVRFCTYCGTQMTRDDLQQPGVDMPRYCAQCFQKFASGQISFASSSSAHNKSSMDTRQKAKSKNSERGRAVNFVGDSVDSGITVEKSMMLEIHKYLKTLNDNMPNGNKSVPESADCKNERRKTLVSNLIKISPVGKLQQEKKSEELLGIRNSIVSPIIHRRSEMLSSDKKPNEIDWDSIKELDEIIAKLDSSIFGSNGFKS